MIAEEVALALDAPMDVIVPRKIRAPNNPELGLGAVAPGVEFLDEHLILALHVDADYLQHEIAFEHGEISRREDLYRRGRPALDVDKRVVIVVDDGIATGGTAIAALRWAKAHGAARVVMAAPVAPAAIRARLSEEADKVVTLLEPESFVAVGQWYENFTQVSDDEVVELMSRALERPAR